MATGQVGEAFYEFLLAAVEVNPVRVLRHRVHLAVEMEIGAVAFGKLVRMLGKRHLQSAPWQRRGTHRAEFAGECQAVALFVLQSAPAHILAVAHALGLGERHKLLLHGAVVQPDERAGLAVVVVVQRTPSVVRISAEPARKLHPVAQTGQRQVGVARDNAARKQYGAAGIDIVELCCRKGNRLAIACRVGHALVRLAGFSCTMFGTAPAFGLAHDSISDNHRPIRIIGNDRLALYFMLQGVQSVLEPLVSCPVVVIHRCTEGGQQQRRILEDGLAFELYPAKAAGLIVKGEIEVLAAHDCLAAFVSHLQSTLLNGIEWYPSVPEVQLLGHLHPSAKTMHYPLGHSFVFFYCLESYVHHFVVGSHAVYHHWLSQLFGHLRLPFKYLSLSFPICFADFVQPAFAYNVGVGKGVAVLLGKLFVALGSLAFAFPWVYTKTAGGDDTLRSRCCTLCCLLLPACCYVQHDPFRQQC